MPVFRIRLTRTEETRMVADFTIEAKTEAAARARALAMGRDCDNDHEWSEIDGGVGRQSVEYCDQVRATR